MKYNIITIEREYASGGSEIGRRLGEKLNLPCYGNEILEEVARRSGTTSAQLQHLEETATNSFLYSIAMMSKMISGDLDGLSDEGAMFIEESKLIWELANKGPSIFVGRCAGRVLREKEDALRVFIHADYDYRKKRALEIYGVESGNVEALLKKSDRRRANYYNANSKVKWDDKTEYHMILDSGRLGIEKCVELIASAVQ